MYRVLVLVIAAVIVVKVSASDAKRASPAPAPAPVRVAAVQPLPPSTPAPVLEVMVDDETESEEADEGIDLDVALERARIATSGGIQGTLRDSRTGETLAGVTICVTSPAMVGVQTAITDENGFFRIVELPEGTYLVTLYYLETTIEYSGIQIGAGKTTPFFHAMDLNNNAVVRIENYGQGITIDQNYIVNIPVPGRTFESVLGAAADSQGEGEGVTFSSGDTLENTYIVDEEPTIY